MITYKQLKSIAEKNGCKIEVNTMYSKPWYNPYSMEEHRTQLGYEIGICNLYGRKGRSEWQWFWFESAFCPKELDDDTQFIFNRRYSQLTGKCNKGVWERINAHDYIKNNA